MIHFFVLASLLVALSVSQPTPFPQLPNATLVVPPVTAQRLVFITGGKAESIALATAKAYDVLGASVTITTRNTRTYNRALLTGTRIKLVELVLGSGCNGQNSPRRVARNYIRDHGRRPDVFIHGALTIVNGIRHDMDDNFMAEIYKQYTIDPIAMEQEFLASDATAAKMTILYIGSLAAWSVPPFYQQMYNARAEVFMENVLSMGCANRFPNTEWLMTFCVFTNTSAMDTSLNPSALPGDLTATGDFAAQEFQRLFKIYLRTRGLPSSFVAQGILQAIEMRVALAGQKVFDVSGPYSSSGIFNLYNQSTNVFIPAYRQVSLGGFGIDITKHTPPVRK